MSSSPVNHASAPPPGRMRPGALAMVLIGALLVLTAGGLALGGVVVAAVAGLQRDGNFLSTSTERFGYDSYALTTPGVEGLRSTEGPLNLPAGLATLQLSATAVPAGRAVF